jgi:hypothetical protein
LGTFFEEDLGGKFFGAFWVDLGDSIIIFETVKIS